MLQLVRKEREAGAGRGHGSVKGPPSGRANNRSLSSHLFSRFLTGDCGLGVLNSPWPTETQAECIWNASWLRLEGLLWLSGTESACNARDRRWGFDPWIRKISWWRKWQPTPVFLPGKAHGQRSFMGYSPWGRRELNMTEQLSIQYWIRTHPNSSILT